MGYIISNCKQHIIKALLDVNGWAIHGITYNKWEGDLGSATLSQAALQIHEHAVKIKFVAFNLWQIVDLDI